MKKNIAKFEKKIRFRNGIDIFFPKISCKSIIIKIEKNKY